LLGRHDMIYIAKEECYRDALGFIRSGLISEHEISHLLDFYEENEHYECCQGILEAYEETKREKFHIDYSYDKTAS